MKKHFKKFFSASLLLLCYQGFSQITTYPYTENFENPSVWQAAPASCDATTAGATFAGWTQDPNDDGDWRADTAGTTSVGTGPGAGRNTSGLGTGTDANPGTTSGTYIYTEATNATTCGGSEINILSPYFDFSDTGKYYQAKINYHMLGTGMGALHIDARQGSNGTWTTGLLTIVGEQDSAWLLDSANLAAFNGDSVQIRIRAVMGTNFLSDLAVDNFVIDTFSPVLADAILVNASFSNLEYPIIPLTQFDSLEFTAVVRNNGLSNITLTQVEIAEGAFQSVVDLGTIAPFTNDTGQSNTKYFATSIGTKEFIFEAIINETETNTANNHDTLQLQVSDTVMARENLTATVNGIGSNNGLLEIGQRFTLTASDTVTSISFYVSNPTAGDSVRAVIRSFNQTPGAIIETTPVVYYVAGQNWYTIPLECISILAAGDYFVSVSQLVATSNMSLGYTDLFHQDSTCFFGAPGLWATLESVGFDITSMIRLNFGHYDTYRELNISSNLDTICQGGQVVMTGDANAAYSWTPANFAFAPNQKTTIFSFDSTTTITATVDFGCGLTATDSKTIYTETAPSASGTPDTTICSGQSIRLQTTGGSSYQWLGGPANQDWIVFPTSSPQRYTALIDSSNGCRSAYQVSITTSTPSVEARGDTAACAGQPVTVSATGSAAYQWRNGPNGSLYTFPVSGTNYAVVIGTDLAGCIATDSVLITENSTPELTPMNDTGACFTKFITLRAGGQADSYLWNDGSTSDSLRFQMFAAKTYTLIAENTNGCRAYDTVFVNRFLRPNGTISPTSNTLVCEGASIKLTAENGATYLWSTGDTTASVDVFPTSAATYSVTIRSAEGCEDFKDVTLAIDPLPTSAFRFLSYEDSVVFTNMSSLATSHSWDFGDGSTSTQLDPYNVYDTSGMYTVTLSASNECGTVDSSITIEVTVPEIINNVRGLASWNTILLFPIPAQDILNLALDNQLFGDVSIQLYDITGKLIRTTKAFKSAKQFAQTIDLTGVESGTYTLQISIAGASVSAKVSKI